MINIIYIRAEIEKTVYMFGFSPVSLDFLS